MKIRKLLKYLPITVMAAGLILAAGFTPIFQSNLDISRELILNNSRQVDDNYNDQLEYIRNDVAGQTGVTNSIVSTKLADSSSSATHSAAILTKTDGSTLLYMWGANNYGQLGNTTNNDNENPNSTPTLVIIPGLTTEKIVQVALGEKHSAALLDDGSLYMWGWNEFGQLGFNANSIPNPIPQKVIPNTASPVVQIALGAYHSAALLKDGSLYMWGNNSLGELGDGTADGKDVPTKITINFISPIKQIALGQQYSAALLDNGTLYMWGYNSSGQLGNDINIGKIEPNPIPEQVDPTYFNSKKITDITLGYAHSFALTEDKSLYTWGLNDYGQLGDGTENNKFLPAEVIINSTSPIAQIALGQFHSAVLLDDGSLYTWGRNISGQLGDTTTNNTSTPILVDSIPFTSRKVDRIALGLDHSAAILEDDSLYMWGDNMFGQLGNETGTGIFAANTTPTWMYKLGKDSRITANPTLTAKEVIDKIWVDDQFNLTGFKNSFNLVNILEIAGQNITMDSKPTPDNVTGTVTMTVKITYFYTEDGLFLPGTTAEEMAITGFVPVVPDVPEEQNPATDNQSTFPFQWWWIVIAIGGIAFIGGISWITTDRKSKHQVKTSKLEAKTEPKSPKKPKK